jgi:hypothetical protein
MESIDLSDFLYFTFTNPRKAQRTNDDVLCYFLDFVSLPLLSTPPALCQIYNSKGDQSYGHTTKKSSEQNWHYKEYILLDCFLLGCFVVIDYWYIESVLS